MLPYTLLYKFYRQGEVTSQQSMVTIICTAWCRTLRS